MQSQQGALSVRKLMNQSEKKRRLYKKLEKLVPIALFLIASVSIMTTAAIIYVLLSESIAFFKEVSIIEFFTGTVLKPMSKTPSFGILPLLVGTLTSTVIALSVAVPIGLLAAIYLS